MASLRKKDPGPEAFMVRLGLGRQGAFPKSRKIPELAPNAASRMAFGSAGPFGTHHRTEEAWGLLQAPQEQRTHRFA